MIPLTRTLVPDDRDRLDRFLQRGGPADVYLRDQLATGGIGDFIGAFEGDHLVGAALFRRAGVCAASMTPRDVGRVLAYEIGTRGPWGSVVGPEPPCDAIAESLRQGDTVRVDRTQTFLVVRRGEPLGPGEPELRRAVPADLDAVVPVVLRYRIEDGLAKPTDSISSWIREHTAERIDSGHLYVVERQDQVVFTGAFNFKGPFGAGVGGIYTVPELRGRGMAARCTAELARIALADSPVATLHVDPSNRSALRAYAKAGFRAAGKFRLTFR